MFNRCSLALAAWLVLSAGSMVLATPITVTPITYDFSGTLDQPVNGAKTFSGSFTLNNAAPFGTDFTSIGNDGANVSATLNLAGQTFLFTNPTDPIRDPSTGSLIHPTNLSMLYTFAGPQAGTFTLTGQNGALPSGSSGPAAALSITLNDPTGKVFPLDPNATSLPILKLDEFPVNNVAVAVSGPGGAQATGTLTSLEPQAVPEPTTLATLALGFGGLVIRRRFKRRVDPSGVLISERCFRLAPILPA